ncbi:pre-mRNA-splicing factor CWC25 [Candida albicans L26]|uniref:Pre-mRNA-splicing factor CWC25 n=2 Tax=Candida albicans TaxID=5476 RepID=CWC25_CANAL|nr:U2-type spliceosomal complex subunit [Candida albicans SC5314]Q59LQ5.2 RecName: Full=Pre-mRNA-splicing factor CWC25 [Candida albicans SC5314]KAF6059912.1 Pre-mRNA splicing factor family protein [Candida albicans]KGQ86808.1 pre-mRNA-splicing factor CWC25 [Candida albicans P37005]KGR11261.1 pre-mRNA-splicing factor CWC25 [Candida albicans P37037]KGT66979.1 pre-mRNA-splicing factor CWC25 [Candida albicans 12C]KGU06348.1 pre-mRNA-splicing factor CWC25 [Candida albicans 19F]KGU06940.1 pre-mRNA|eukprot:XP_710662.2 U2-type spliceosomal complex subunit [Candida albicans SC5314]
MAGDLNLKKSWNPALVKNQQKVWEEEQQKLDELKRIKERNQEYKQEQEYLELLKLQHGDQFQIKDLNKQQKLKISKLNWMYDDVPFEGNEKVEENSSGFIESNVEFTDGKSKVENLLKGNHVVGKKRDGSGTSDRINKIIGVGMTKSSKVSYSDDPLLKIKQQQQQAQRVARKQHPSDKHSHRSRHSSKSSSDRVHKSHEHERSRKHNSSHTRHKDGSPHR